LEEFRKGTAKPYDWRTIQIRVLVGHEMAKAIYSNEVFQALVDALAAVRTIELRYEDSGCTRLVATAMEIELINIGMEVTDNMQDEMNSKDILTYFKLAEKAVGTPKYL
jgi:hypothetical protein